MFRSRSALFVLALLCLQGCKNDNDTTAPLPPPANNAPVASDMEQLIEPDTVLSLGFEASDADGDPLTFSIDSAPQEGSVVVSGAEFEYTPASGYSGEDSFTFVASDGSAVSNVATVTITVNAAPAAQSAHYATSDIGVVDGEVPVTDQENDTLAFELAALPTKGTVTGFDGVSGEFTYTPDATEDGVDSFEVTVSDGWHSSVAAIQIEIFKWSGTQMFGTTENDDASTGGLVLLDSGRMVIGALTEGAIDGAVNAGSTDALLHTLDRRGVTLQIEQSGDTGIDNLRVIRKSPLDGGFFTFRAWDSGQLQRRDDAGNETWRTDIDLPGLPAFYEAYWGTVDSAGNAYVLSELQPLLPPDDLPTYAFVLGKYEAATGTLLWQKIFYPSALDPVNAPIADTWQLRGRAVNIDPAGNLLVTVRFATFGGSRPCGTCPGFLWLSPEDGSLLQAAEPEVSALGCSSPDITDFYRTVIDEHGGITVTGTALGASSTDGIVARYAPDGTTTEWSYCESLYNASINFFSEPLLTQDGGIVAMASTEFGLVAESSESSVLSILKFDGTGSLAWRTDLQPQRGEGLKTYSYAGSAAEDGQGLLYVTGSTDGALDGVHAIGKRDCFIMRLDANGNIR